MPSLHASPRGFTLVELMVALFALSVLALVSWRGLDAMVRTQSSLQARGDEVLALQAGLAQWRADLDAAVVLPGLGSLDWDGQMLRLLRRTDAGSRLEADGVMVVAWTQRAGPDGRLWRRWQSLPLTDRASLAAAWEQARLWARNPGASERARETAVLPLDGWQVYSYRDDAWTHPQSSEDTQSPNAGSGAGSVAGAGARAPSPRGSLPAGVRLVLRLPSGPAVAGTVTLDWVNPRWSGGR